MTHEEALRQFITDHYPQLHAYASYAAYGCPDLAHDLLGDAIELLLSGRQTIDLSNAPLRYIQLLITRCRRNYYPSDFVLACEYEGLEEIEADQQQAEREEVGRYVQQEWLYEHIAALRPRNQHILYCYLDGIPPKEIGAELGLSRAKIWTWRAASGVTGAGYPKTVSSGVNGINRGSLTNASFDCITATP